MQVRQAMRDLGAFAQYNPPPDLTNMRLPGQIFLRQVGAFTVTIGTGFPSTRTKSISPSHAGHRRQRVRRPVRHASTDLSTPSTPKYVWMGAVVTLHPFILTDHGREHQLHGATPMSKRMWNDRRGVAAWMVGAAIIPLVGMVSLGTEIGSWNVIRRHAQNTADAAAIAGATALLSTTPAEPLLPVKPC